MLNTTFDSLWRDISPFAVGFDRTFDTLALLASSRAKEANYPPYNIRKVSEDQYTIELAVAGFEEKDIDNIELLEAGLISIVIIDLTCDDVDPYKMGENMRLSSDLPIFGILDKFNRKEQNKARDCGFDLVFTKSMLLKSIKEIVVHISNEK